MAGSDTAAFLNHHIAFLVFDVKYCDFTTQSFRIKLQSETFFLLMEDAGIEEHTKNFFRAITQRAQQDSRRQLAATVNTHIENIFRVKFKVQPRAAVRNHAGGVKQLTRGVGLAFIVVENNTRRSMQLRNDNALSPINNKGTVICHQRDFAEVDFLLADIFNRLVSRFFIIDNQANADT